MARGGIPLVLLVLVNYLTIKQQEPASLLLTTMVLELLTGMAISLTGIPAGIGMLWRQSWGANLAALCVVATLASFGVPIWQLPLTINEQAAPGTPERIWMIIVGILVVLIRLGLLAAYIAAVVQFITWHRSLSRPTA